MPRLFVGRTRELAALEEALRVADRAVVTQAITGLGGVGKTRLAERYVSAHLDDYDVVAWIRAEDGGIADLSELAAALGESVDELSPAERRDLALAHLSRGEERWLLVLDNIESPARLTDCLPRGGGGRVLVTSRNRDMRQFAPTLRLEIFDEDTAIEYLVERAERPHDRAGAQRLARALGYLPLALVHAAAYCAAGERFDDYLELLALPVEELFDASPEVSYAQTVASTWRASIAPASAKAPLAGDVLAVAAHLGPDAIPKDLFAVLIDSGLASDRKRLSDSLGALHRFSLATVKDDAVSVHRLLQKVVRDETRARSDQAPIARALDALDRAFPTDPADPSRWPRSEQLLAHVIALADGATHVPEVANQLVTLLNRACLYLIKAEGGARALALAQRTVATATDILGAEHRATLKARNYEAYSYRRVGQASQAVALFEVLLGDQERALGLEHPDTLGTRLDLASVYRESGRIQEALAMFEPLLADWEPILGPEDRDTLLTRNNLAPAHYAAGRVQKAIAIFEPLLADFERILGPEDADTLITRNNLALAYRADTRVTEAIAIFEPLLAERERVLGPEHPYTLSTRNNLALAYLADGRVEEAIAIYEPLIADFEQVRGAEHPYTLRTRHHLAHAYHTAGRVQDAIAIYKSLLAARERVLGTAHPDTLRTRRNLAVAYRSVGRDAEATALEESDAGGSARNGPLRQPAVGGEVAIAIVRSVQPYAGKRSSCADAVRGESRDRVHAPAQARLGWHRRPHSWRSCSQARSPWLWRCRLDARPLRPGVRTAGMVEPAVCGPASRKGASTVRSFCSPRPASLRRRRGRGWASRHRIGQSNRLLTTVAPMHAANLPVAVVGMAGAGKSEVSGQLVREYGFERIYFGQVVLDELAARGLRPGPESERIVREGLRQTAGMNVMARRSLPAIRAALDAGRRVCIDGLYSGAEWELLGREVGLVTLAVHAPRWLRKQRAGGRPVRPLSGLELDERDLAEVMSVDKAAPIALADLHIVNDGSLDELSARVAMLVEQLTAAASARLKPSVS